jgi:hypothetical protein
MLQNPNPNSYHSSLGAHGEEKATAYNSHKYPDPKPPHSPATLKTISWPIVNHQGFSAVAQSLSKVSSSQDRVLRWAVKPVF